MSSQPFPEIKILPSSKEDYLALASLENAVVYDEPFSTVAYGPRRDSAYNISLRARSFARGPSSRNETKLLLKAVIGDKIVGGAAWNFVQVGNEEKRAEKKEEEGGEEEDSGGWGEGANVKFCEDILLVADEHMARKCEGRGFAKLSTLFVAPNMQRRGIGTKLLKAGLKIADEKGLQCVLGASKEGLGLYQKYGFEIFEIMPLKLWEYEGGEGLGEDRHVVMHRPAVQRKG